MYDDFLGGNYDDRWWAGRGTGSLTALADGILRVRATAGASYELYQGDFCNLSVAGLAVMNSRWKCVDVTSVQGKIGFEAASPDNASDWIAFIFDSAISVNWLCQSAASGSVTTVDTGVACSTAYYEFRIETRPGQVTFFLNGVLIATITTNISSLLLQPYAYVVATGASARDIYFDWLEVFGDRAS
jgi:hypothetical protein